MSLPQKKQSLLQDRSTNEPLVDFQQVIFRHKALVAFGIVLGLVAGAIFFAQSEPVYRSSADVLIVSKRPEVVAGGATSFLNDYLSTHQALIVSSVIVNSALDRPEMAALRTKKSDVVRGLHVTKSEVADNILKVSFEGKVREDCSIVVTAILDTYQDYLNDTYESMSTDTVQLMKQAQDMLALDLNKQEENYRNFRKNSPLLLKTDTPVQDRLTAIQARQSELMVRHVELKSQLESIKLAIEEGLDYHTLAFIVSNLGLDFDSAQLEQERDLPKETAEPSKGQLEMSDLRDKQELTQQLESILLPLVQQEEQLLETFGPNHPSLASIQKRIKAARASFQNLEATLKKQKDAAIERMPRSGYRDWTIGNGQILNALLVEVLENEIVVERKKTQERLTIARSELSRDDLNIVDSFEARKDLRDSFDREYVELGVAYVEQQLNQITTTQLMLSKLHDEAYRQAKELTDYELDDSEYQRNMSRTQQLYDGIVSQLQDANLRKDYGGFKADVISPAGLGYQVKPEALIIFPAGLFLGGLIGSLLAFAAELTNRSYRSSDEIEKDLVMPVLGRINQVFTPPKSKQLMEKLSDEELDRSLCTFHRPNSPESECYRGLRTALYFNNRNNDLSVIQMTSACPRDGKSTTAANVSISIAQSGKRVLLIDADLRKPRQHKIFGFELGSGLSDLISSDIEIEDVVRETQIDNLSIMTAGHIAPDPAELLSSPRFGELMSALREQFDYVLVDSGPLLAVSDPRIIVSHVDGVILTVRVGQTSRKHAQSAKQFLDYLDAPILGLVANDCGVAESYGYGYGAGRYVYGASNQKNANGASNGKAQAKRLTEASPIRV